MADIYVFKDDESEDTQTEESPDVEEKLRSEENSENVAEEGSSKETELTETPSQELYSTSYRPSSSTNLTIYAGLFEYTDEGEAKQSPDGTEFERSLLSPSDRFIACTQAAQYFELSYAAQNVYDSMRYVVENKPETFDNFIKYVYQLCETTDVQLLKEIMEQVPQIACLCYDHSAVVGDLMPNLFTPKVVHLLTHDYDQVRKTSQAALLVLLEQDLLQVHEIEKMVCSKIEENLSIPGDAFRAEIVALVSKMMPLLPTEASRLTFVNKYRVLCSDPHMTVRKMCAGSFVDFANAASREITEDILLPRFIELCNDPVWGVRKTCAEMFTRASYSVSLDARRNVLAPAFQSLLQDHSRWVKVTAYQGLGMFLSTFADPTKTGIQYNEDGSFTFFEPTYVETDDHFGAPSISHLLPEESAYNELNFWKSPLPDIELPPDLIATVDPPEEEVQKRDNEAESTGSIEESTSILSQEAHDQSNESDSGLEDEPEYDSGQWEIIFALASEFGHKVSEIKFGKPQKSGTESEADSAASSPCNSQNSNQYTMFKDESRVSTSRSSFMSYVEPLLTIPLMIEQNIIPSSLLVEYINLADPVRSDAIDSEVRRDCAYAFPGVVLALGRDYWPGLLHTYQALVSDVNWKVRRPLAFSIHEVALILGQEITERDLFPIFLEFIRDLDEIRLGILRHLSDFVMPLSKECKLQLLPKIDGFLRLDNPTDWRFRLEFAQQLVPLSDLYSHEECWIMLCPLALQLLAGKVVQIRRVCYSVLSQLAHKLSLDSDHVYLSYLCRRLQTMFAQGSTWSKRQSYAYVAGQILEDNNLPVNVWIQHFLGPLLEGVTDLVPNVRIAVAKVLNSVLLSKDYFNDASNPEYEQVRAALTELKNDGDRDVRYFALSDVECRELELSEQLIDSLE